MATTAYLAIQEHVKGIAGGDLERTGTRDIGDPGEMFFLRDFTGLKLFHLVQNRSGSAMAQGELVAGVGDDDGITSAGTITGGSTTHVITSGLTADSHVGAILYVTDDAGAAGAAPESEASRVIANSATRIDLDPDYPLSAAIAASDTASMLATYNVEDAAANDLNHTVKGVVIPKDGIADDALGFVQAFGVCHKALFKASTSVAVNAQLIADTARLNTIGASSTLSLVVGRALAPASDDIANDFILAFLACGHMAFAGASTLDATA